MESRDSTKSAVSGEGDVSRRRRTISGSASEADKAHVVAELFGESAGELITDCSCAIDDIILLHGRMYLTEKYLCFYSNIFAAEKRVRIPLLCIDELIPEFTALVIPNAICVKTNRGEYKLRSFWDRDGVLEKITGAREEVVKLSKKRNVSFAPPAGAPEVEAPSPTQLTPSPTQLTPSPTQLTPSPTQLKKSFSLHGNAFKEDEDIEDFTDFKDVAEHDDVLTALENFIVSSALKNHVLKESLAMNIVDFLQLFVNDGAECGYGKYHESIEDENVVASPWEGDFTSTIGGHRNISFFKIVNLPGLKSTRGVKAQKIRRFGDWGCVIQSSTRLEDVPMATSFTVEDMLAVKALDKDTLEISIHFEVKFDPSLNSFFRFTVESSTNPEMTKWMKTFFNDNLKAHAQHYDINTVSIDSVAASERADDKIIEGDSKPKDNAFRARVGALFDALATSSKSLTERLLTQTGINLASFIALSYQMYLVNTLKTGVAGSTTPTESFFNFSSALSSYLSKADINTVIFAIICYQLHKLTRVVEQLKGKVP